MFHVKHSADHPRDHYARSSHGPMAAYPFVPPVGPALQPGDSIGDRIGWQRAPYGRARRSIRDRQFA